MWLLKLYNTLKVLRNSSKSQFVSYDVATNLPNRYLNTKTFIDNDSNNNLLNSRAFASFKTFVSVGSTTVSGLLSVHPSNRQLFLKTSAGSGNFISLRLLFQVYKSFNSLLFSVLYYNIKLLSFGNSVFRQDISAINWSYISYYSSVFKFNNLSIFFQPNKLNDKFPKAFKFLKMNGFHTSVVYDSNYHKRTIYYLQRLSFFSIGIIPANMPKYTLNVSLPTLNDTLLMHLYMLRLFVKTKQKSDNKSFKSLYSLWSKY
jgi:hypothetical protein